MVPRPVFERYYDERTGEFGGRYALYAHEFVLRELPVGRGFLYETDDAAKVASLLACFVAIANAEDALRVTELDAAEQQAAAAKADEKLGSLEILVNAAVQDRNVLATRYSILEKAKDDVERELAELRSKVMGISTTM